MVKVELGFSCIPLRKETLDSLLQFTSKVRLDPQKITGANIFDFLGGKVCEIHCWVFSRITWLSIKGQMIRKTC